MLALDSIKNDKLTPRGRAAYQQAALAAQQLRALDGLKLDKATAGKARQELIAVISGYCRTNFVKRLRRKKHTRG